MSAFVIYLIGLVITWPLAYGLGWMHGWQAHRDKDKELAP